MITTTMLVYYGICAILIVAGLWFLIKCPLLPPVDDSVYSFDDED